MQIRRTEKFAKWLRDLRDTRGRAKIFDRLDRLAAGNPGKARSVGAGIVELKIDYGPLGYRVYYVQRGELLILLLR
jgi:putative addiction module killer protein